MDTNAGLEGVVAADTMLSEVDGERGRLTVRGYGLAELVGRRTFEEMTELLLAGFFPELAAPPLRAALGAAREEVFASLPQPDERLLALTPAETLRALLARLADGEDFATALRLIAAPGVFVGTIGRWRAGLQAIPPDRAAGHAADVLRMLRGVPVAEPDAHALDQYLVTVAEHGLNASTFAARIVASTRAGLASACIAALCALKGPLHGGAPGPVLDMLDAIGTADRAPEWLEQSLRRGERLMGFGHRIYRVRDPRADALRACLQRLGAARAIPSARLELADAVEAAALSLLRREKPERALETNVEFYTALLLEALAVPRGLFTCFFSVGRIAGWIAHAREQVLNGRLIRPSSRYIGPAPSQAA